jgi:hypothetical protein
MVTSMYPFEYPSAQQSGLKLKINQTLTGATHEVLYSYITLIVVQAGSSGKI